MESNCDVTGICYILHIQVCIPQIPPDHNRSKKEQITERILTTISEALL